MLATRGLARCGPGVAFDPCRPPLPNFSVGILRDSQRFKSPMRETAMSLCSARLKTFWTLRLIRNTPTLRQLAVCGQKVSTGIRTFERFSVKGTHPLKTLSVPQDLGFAKSLAPVSSSRWRSCHHTLTSPLFDSHFSDYPDPSHTVTTKRVVTPIR